MEKAVLYARVSSKEQEEEGYSIPSQIKLLREYAKKNNYQIVTEYPESQSAKKPGRKLFNAMLSKVRADKSIRHVLVEKTDRLTRNGSDSVAVDELVNETGVMVHLVKENEFRRKDSSSDAVFINDIKIALAKKQIGQLSEETKKGMLEKAEQKIYPSVAPHGYINGEENGKRVIKTDPQAKIFVEKVFHTYVYEASSIKDLRDRLLNDGVIYKNGKTLYTSMLERILKNRTYALIESLD